jgi:hypothetical protein
MNAAWFPFWLQIQTPVYVPEWLGIDPLRLRPSTRVKATFLYRPFDLVAGARMLAALLGACTILWVFLLAREFVGKHLALGASALYTVSFLSVRDSHFATNDMAMAFWVTLAGWLMVKAYRGDRTRDWILASALGGIAVAMKYNAFPLLLALGVLRFLSLKKGEAPFSWLIYVRSCLLYGGVAVLTFLLICPFPFLDPSTFWNEIRDLSEKSQNQWSGQANIWSGWMLLDTLYTSEGGLTLLFALLGLGLACARWQWELILFPLLYSLLIMTHPLFFARFAIPLLPWLALLALLGIRETVGRWRCRNAGMGILLLLCLIQPLAKDLRFHALMRQTDTRIQCVHWFKTSVPEPVLIAAGMFGIPIPYRNVEPPWSTLLDTRFVLIDTLPTDELSRLDQLSYPLRYIALSHFDPFPGHWPEFLEERRQAVCRYLQTEKPIQVFSPFRDGWEGRVDVEDSYAPFRDLWSRSGPGPQIEIYQRS